MSQSEKVQVGSGQETPAGLETPAAARHGAGASWKVVLLLLASVGAVLFIILDSGEDAVFAYTVDQALEQRQSLVGKNFRVRGKVEEGSIEAKQGSLEMRFQINHEDKLMTVAYNKPLPDTFKAGIEVIAEGELTPEGVLVADQVIAKCPSKYEEGAPTGEGGALGKEGHPAEGGY
jgi:cytochrome c-type biogenesis protein CcmE